jgi:uncharacterized coiled-coil protein SlyX
LTQVTKTSEAQTPTETADKQLSESAAPARKSSRKSVLALSVLALAINGTAAIYTMPSFNVTLPDYKGMLAELLPHQGAPAPDPVVTALKDIQSAQQQQAGALQANGSALLQSTALLQQDSTTLASLRQSITDEQSDVKKISTQLSTLIAKVDTLQSAIAPEVTSSIPKGRARNRLSVAAHKRIARQARPGPISVGGAPLSVPLTAPAPEG